MIINWESIKKDSDVGQIDIIFITTTYVDL